MQGIRETDGGTLNWLAVKERFDAVRRGYQEAAKAAGVPALTAEILTLEPLAARYDRGERSGYLYAAMAAVEPAPRVQS